MSLVDIRESFDNTNLFQQNVVTFKKDKINLLYDNFVITIYNSYSLIKIKTATYKIEYNYEDKILKMYNKNFLFIKDNQKSIKLYINFVEQDISKVNIVDNIKFEEIKGFIKKYDYNIDYVIKDNITNKTILQFVKKSYLFSFYDYILYDNFKINNQYMGIIYCVDKILDTEDDKNKYYILYKNFNNIEYNFVNKNVELTIIYQYINNDWQIPLTKCYVINTEDELKEISINIIYNKKINEIDVSIRVMELDVDYESTAKSYYCYKFHLSIKDGYFHYPYTKDLVKFDNFENIVLHIVQNFEQYMLEDLKICDEDENFSVNDIYF